MWHVRKLTGDVNLRSFVACEGILNHYGLIGGSVAKRAELTSLVKYVFASHDVDCKACDDAEPIPTQLMFRSFSVGYKPCWTVAGSHSQEIPISRDPTPKPGRPVYFTSFRGFDETIHERRYECPTVADQHISPFERPQPSRGILVKQCQIHVDSHCQIPHCVSRKKPMK